MNRPAIEDILDRVVRAAVSGAAQAENFAAWRRGPKPGVDPNALQQLLTQLTRDPALSVFGGFTRYHNGTGFTLRYEDLADWLIYSSIHRSPAQAVNDLEAYLAAPRIRMLHVLVIVGVQPETRFEMAGGINLIPVAELSESVGKHAVTSPLPSSYPIAMFPFQPLAALTQWVEVPKADFDELPAFEVLNHYNEPFLLSKRELLDAMMLLAVFGGAPIPVASWAEYEETTPYPDLPAVKNDFDVDIEYGISTNTPINAEAASELLELHQKFVAMPLKDKTRLEIPLGRLNLAIRRRSLVNAAIDLGIALESVFLGDLTGDRGELSFRLRLRAARWLGSDEQTRGRLMTTFNRLYSLRSQAVHSGTIGDSSAASQLLAQGFELTGDAIGKIVLEGWPKWDSLILQ